MSIFYCLVVYCVWFVSSCYCAGFMCVWFCVCLLFVMCVLIPWSIRGCIWGPDPMLHLGCVLGNTLCFASIVDTASCIPLWHRCLLSKRYGKGFIVLPLWILNYSNTLALSQWQKICFQDCLFRDSTHHSILGSFLTTTDSFGRGLIISHFRNKKIANTWWLGC